MLQEKRLHRIRALLATLSQVSTERIIKELGVSRETARRDIIELAAQGLARRVHGGLVAIDTQPEPPLTIRNTVRAKEKRAIARAAVRLLSPGQTLFLDAGSTTTMLADELRSMSGLTIITNSLNAALKLSAAEEYEALNNEVILLGGSMMSGASQTRGDLTVNEIHRYRADIALLSPVGIDSQNGATSFHLHEAAIAQAMVRQSAQRILLADYSKLGITSRMAYAACTEINVLVTDCGAIKQPAFALLQKRLPKVIVG
ncbi:alkaline phosphatase [[Pantoea] beijingensis]|uniref:Alkaline phosphatase n=1 Tax=[Pantoea] beijingensis TaxID=1324864 RepID=A0A443IH07_9GAMM|nr:MULTISPECIES: DeoR/GlpR family DNA-binding transcription regulator [Erwiniaceae]RWR03280.1 alkaline phosphatase [[Pantoea] beijingensis]